MQFFQNYDPLHNGFLSTLVAAIPLLTLLYLLAFHPWTDKNGVKHKGIAAPKAAGIATLIGFAIAIFVLKMPAQMAASSFVYGALNGLVPICWILVAAMFLYHVTCVTGQFDVVKESITKVSSDRRIQVLIIAFALGAFLEGAAGFGIPVAIAGAMMVGLGFKPFQAAVLNLLANPVPVAFGAIGSPIITLGKVTGLDDKILSAIVGLELAPFCLFIPLIVIATMVKMDRKPWRKVTEVWPALVVAGGVFTTTQYLVATYMGPNLVGILGGLVTLFALVLLSAFWKPATPYDEEEVAPARKGAKAKLAPIAGATAAPSYTTGQIVKAWMPWVLLTLFVFAWGQPAFKAILNKPLFGVIPTVISIKMPFLDGLVYRMPPVVIKQAAEKAVFALEWLSTPGTSIFLAAVASGLLLKATGAQWKEAFGRLGRLKNSLITVTIVLGFGYLIRFTGIDGILGLAFTKSGFLYPFFAPILGWVGVFITGSDTSANAMFGSLQQITARQLGMSEYMIASANTAGGVMGKMIGAQSILVATAATYENQEEGKAAVGEILRAVVWYSVVLVVLMGVVVMSMNYLMPGLAPK